jgi:hypothetical protein
VFVDLVEHVIQTAECGVIMNRFSFYYAIPIHAYWMVEYRIGLSVVSSSTPSRITPYQFPVRCIYSM